MDNKITDIIDAVCNHEVHAEIINRVKILELLVDKQLTTDGIVHHQVAGAEDGLCVYAEVTKLSQRVDKVVAE